MTIAALTAGLQATQVAQTGNAGHTAETTKKSAEQTAPTDKVTISKQAAALAYQSYSAQEEAKETPTQKTKEASMGKK